MKNLKKSNLLVLMAVLTVFAFGCKPIKNQKDLDKEINDIVNKNKQENEQLMDSLVFNDGGQPGRITLDGVVVDTDKKIDSRIIVSQQTGLRKSGEITKMWLKEPVQMNSMKSEDQVHLNAKLKDLEKERTYINLGCEVSESEIAGLTDITKKSVSSVQFIASRIFICGEHKLDKALVVMISASEVYLKNVDLNIGMEFGGITISASTLVLLESNKVTGQSVQNSDSFVSQAASISLFVGQEIYGEGLLRLESLGKNYSVKKQ